MIFRSAVVEFDSIEVQNKSFLSSLLTLKKISLLHYGLSYGLIALHSEQQRDGDDRRKLFNAGIRVVTE